jgi:hypothetical protein
MGRIGDMVDNGECLWVGCLGQFKHIFIGFSGLHIFEHFDLMPFSKKCSKLFNLVWQ